MSSTTNSPPRTVSTRAGHRGVIMVRTICKSKIHRAKITEANLDYTGSLTVDAQLMRAADLVPYEQVDVLNLTNGERIQTYCIEAPSGSGTVCINGAAAHVMSAGEKIIILSYAQMTDEEREQFVPKIILVDEWNRIQQVMTPPRDARPEGPVSAFGGAAGGGVTEARQLSPSDADAGPSADPTP